MLGVFYFDRQRPDSVLSSAVWRAVVAQMLHNMPASDPDGIDTLLLFIEGRDQLAGQTVASDVEIFSVLCLLLSKFDQFTLVVDGIDECQDQTRFWKNLELLSGTPTRLSAALFSRPTVEIPLELAPVISVLTLDSNSNLDDITAFLHPRITDLLDRGLISQIDRDKGKTVDQIAQRADAMFLWAVLFVDYIQSPYLSLRDRHQAIHNLNRLEGLDMLYAAILQTLAGRVERARMHTLGTFQIVLHSMRPLHVSELRHAIAVPTSRRLDSDDLILDFAENIGRLSGALMELDKDGFVRFVHLSIIEYLTGLVVTPSGHNTSWEFTLASSMDKQASHIALACRCLSYLYNTVEAAPLSKSSQVSPEAEIQIKKYPFLNYTSEYWSHHLLESMELMNTHTTSTGPAIEELVQLASTFLSTEKSIMAWIEACWMFQRPPQIRHGPADSFFSQNLSSTQPKHTSVSVTRTLHEALEILKQLSVDLKILNKAWSDVLSDEPNEIWEPSISAFHQSVFWQRITGARVAHFEQPVDPGHRAICLKTRISADGQRLGLVRLYIPESAMCPTSSTPGHTRLGGMSLHFETWLIENLGNRKLSDVKLDVPESCYSQFVYDIVCSKEGLGAMNQDGEQRGEFQFPIAITAHLQRIVLPGCIVNLPPSATSQSIQKPSQIIDFNKKIHQHDRINRQLGTEDFDPRYDLQVSDTGKYLMTIHKSVGMVDVDSSLRCHLRLITIYEDTSHVAREPTPHRPSYQRVASIAFKPHYLYNKDHEGGILHIPRDENGDWCALLHPRYPTVAIRFQRFVVFSGQRGVLQRGREHSTDGTNSALWNFKDLSGILVFLTLAPDHSRHLCAFLS